jgi:hypothetical protein
VELSTAMSFTIFSIGHKIISDKICVPRFHKKMFFGKCRVVHTLFVSCEAISANKIIFLILPLLGRMIVQLVSQIYKFSNGELL